MPKFSHYKNLNINRRQAIQAMGLIALSPYLSRCSFLSPNHTTSSDDFLKLYGPIDRNIAKTAQKNFSGDEFGRPHAVLWNKPEFLEKIGGPPAPSRTTEVLIVGGGMSGLTTAYQLRAKRPVLMEQATRFGGNSKGESWSGIDYSIGAAYIIKPESDSDILRLLTDIKATEKWTVKKDEGAPILNGVPIPHFWQGKSDIKKRHKFKRVEEYFRSFMSDDGREFPDYPTRDEALRKYLNQLDQKTFKQQIEQETGTLHPHVATLLEHYCFSSFGGSMNEISAAAGINFFAAEFSDVCVFPGGNSCITQLLLENLYRQLPANNLLSGHLVFDVREQSNGVLVTYLDPKGKVSSILAGKVVMSCPKFIAAKLIDNLSGIDKHKAQAIDNLSYRSYMVANMMINHNLNIKDYDLFWLGKGNVDLAATREYADRVKVTDIVNANFASPSTEKSVLSLYRAFPYDGARPILKNNSSYEKFSQEFETQIGNDIIPYFNLKKSEVSDLRLTRWGHPLPLAKQGLLLDGTLDHVSRPINDKIFFVEQDNWALPAFETAATEALYWSSIISST